MKGRTCLIIVAFAQTCICLAINHWKRDLIFNSLTTRNVQIDRNSLGSHNSKNSSIFGHHDKTLNDTDTQTIIQRTLINIYETLFNSSSNDSLYNELPEEIHRLESLLKQFVASIDQNLPLVGQKDHNEALETVDALASRMM